MFLNEIFKIETPVAISERDEEMDYWMQTGNIPTSMRTCYLMNFFLDNLFFSKMKNVILHTMCT